MYVGWTEEVRCDKDHSGGFGVKEEPVGPQIERACGGKAVKGVNEGPSEGGR